MLVAGREPREMQSLAEVGPGRLRIALGPERLHDFEPVHPVRRREREKFHHVRRATAAPGVARDRDAVNRGREPAEELYRDRSHRTESYGRAAAPTSGPSGTVAERSAS